LDARDRKGAERQVPFGGIAQVVKHLSDFFELVQVGELLDLLLSESELFDRVDQARELAELGVI
jgi:hypothetical protein